MDLQSLEKKIIYLKGVQSGILQGTNPNVSKYKQQIDFELNLLENQFSKLNNNKQQTLKEQTLNNNKQFNLNNKEVNLNNKEVNLNNKEVNLKEEEEKNDENDNNKFKEISKQIIFLKEKVFQNNNIIKMLSRNKTYQNSMKIQNIIRDNNKIQFQIQQNQQIYDILKLKINNNPLYQKLFNKSNETNNIQENNIIQQNIIKENNIQQNKIVKSILKKSNSNEYKNEDKKHIQINVSKNSIKEIPSNNETKKIVLQKKVSIPVKKVEEFKIDESDEDLMKEFQNTIGSLQKLLS